MAASNLNLGKASGGVLNVQPADGTTTTSLVLPAINGTVVAADSNGNVGIGTSSPVTKLTVNHSVNAGEAVRIGNSVGGSGSVQGSTYIGLNHWGVTDTLFSSALIGVIEDGASSYNASVIFSTRGSGTDSLATERMRIDSSGNVGIGTTPSTWSTSGNIELMDSRVITMRGNINISSNGYYNSGWKAINTGEVTNLYTNNGGWVWQSAPSTTAGSTPSFSTKMNLDLSGNLLLTSGTGGLGYGTGAGGTVTQLTSKSTTVTLNKPSGQITMNNAALAAGASVYFAVNNIVVDTSCAIVASIVGDGSIASVNNYEAIAIGCVNGYFWIRLTNKSAVSLSEAVKVQFDVLKGAVA